MEKINFKFNKEKITLFILMGFLLITFFYSNYYLAEICTSPNNCTSTERNGFWLPLAVFSLYSLLILLPFLFLPVNYFKSWAIKIASWSVPFATILVLGESPRGGGVLALGRETMVILTALIIACLTLVLILYTYAKNHERYRAMPGFWYFILLGILLYGVTYLAPFLVG